jgi:hypothetical protein
MGLDARRPRCWKQWPKIELTRPRLEKMTEQSKGWSEQEEAKIAELMKEDKLTRIQAIHKMQRLKQDKKWRPTDA